MKNMVNYALGAIKRLFLLIFATSMAVGVAAQTAVDVYDIDLEDGDEFEISTYVDNKAYGEQEKSIAKDFANQLKSSALYRAIAGEDADTYQGTLEFGIEDLIEGTKSDRFSPIIEWLWFRAEMFHKLAQNKIFRNFMKDRACEILKVLCKLYPASTKQVILDKIDKASRLLDEMSKHNYALVKTPHKYHDGTVYYSKDLQKDGKVLGDKMTQKEVEMVFGLEGWFARRMVIDGISLAEMKEFFKTARQAVAGVDVSQKPMYAECYNINKDLKVFVGTDDVFCQFANGKKIPKLYSITFMKDPTGSYYKIINNLEEVWVMNQNKWVKQARSVLYTDKGEKVFEEKITIK